MKGLYLKFTDSGTITLEPEIVVDNLSLLRQNAAVVLLTIPGTDAVFPDKGTNILLDATFGKVSDFISASHSGNFAAVKLSDYLKDYEYSENTATGNTYSAVKINVNTVANGLLKFDMTFDQNTTQTGVATF